MQTVITACIFILVIGFALFRRLRAQQVRPVQIVVTAAIIVVISLVSLFSTDALLTNTLALVLALPALAIGLGGGFLLMRSIRFWRNEQTGDLWMKGGVLYLTVWLATLILREGAAYANGAFTKGKPTFILNPTLAALATDLVLISVGLWIARAIAVVLKYRAFKQGTETTSSERFAS